MISLIVLILVFFMILCLITIAVIDTRKNVRLSYRIQGRLKRLNYPNIIKMWTILQLIIIFLKSGNSPEEWIISISIPIIIMSLVLINAIVFADTRKEEKIDEDDFKSYKRNQKIDKIVK